MGSPTSSFFSFTISFKDFTTFCIFIRKVRNGTVIFFLGICHSSLDGYIMSDVADLIFLIFHLILQVRVGTAICNFNVSDLQCYSLSVIFASTKLVMLLDIH